MSKKSVVIILTICSLVLFGCIFEKSASPTPTKADTSNATSLAQSVKATVDAQTTSLAPTTGPAATEKIEPSSTPQPTLTATLSQQELSDLTATAASAAGENTMASMIDQMYKDGQISKKDGEFHAIDDFDQSWAQIGWYQWWGTGFAPKSFLIKADTSWASASDVSNWPEAGCGFVFGEQDKNNHFVVYLGLDGNVYLASIHQGNWKNITKKYYGNVSVPDGDASVMLSVIDDQISYFVNKTKVIGTRYMAYKPGNLDLTLLSGTNKDFGTRCKMTNVGLWIFK